MTIIIGDAIRMVIVTDSQVSDDESHTKSLDEDKVYEIPEGFIGGAGCVSSIQRVVEWFKNGKKEKEKPEIASDSDADFIIINSQGIFTAGKDLELCKVVRHDAIGSGQAIALGAMKLGHSAEEATWAATQIDLTCGGDIKVYSLKKKSPTIYYHKG